MGREKLETLATTIDQGAGMKTDSVCPIVRIRRKNLSVLVDAHGLAVVARRAGKPDRQIKDIIAGRKSFGEKIARAIEAAYDPDAPLGWLDIDPDVTSDSQEAVKATQTSHPVRDAISAADRELLSRYRSAASETRAAVDLLLLSKSEREMIEPSMWTMIVAVESQSLSALRKVKRADTESS